MAAKRSTKPPVVDPDPTLRELPQHKIAKRLKDALAVRERIQSAATAPGVAMYAECVSCRAAVHDWRGHLKDRRTAEDSDEAVVLEYPGACGVCGGSVVELHAEDDPKRDRSAQASPSAATKGSGRRSSRAPSRTPR